MRTGDAVPLIEPSASLRDGLLEMTKKGLGMVAITNSARQVLGIVTDGDLRRVLDSSPDLAMTTMNEVMTRNPRCIHADALAVDALHEIEGRHISGLLVLNNKNLLVDAFNIHDLLNAKVV